MIWSANSRALICLPFYWFSCFASKKLAVIHDFRFNIINMTLCHCHHAHGRKFKRPSTIELSDFGCFIIVACGITVLQQIGLAILCFHSCIIHISFWFWSLIRFYFLYWNLCYAHSPSFFVVLDISLIYHIIRGQATIKLYVIYNVLEVSIN
jgi:hypothetical protein